VLLAHAVEQPSVGGTESARALPAHPRLPHLEQASLVVAEHDVGAETLHELEHGETVRTARQEISDEAEAVVAGPADLRQELLELPPAAVDISDDDRARHASLNTSR